MSFFGALGSIASGYQQGRQQRQDNQYEQQNQAQAHADAATNQAIRQHQLAMEKTQFDEGQQDRQRSQGVDPNTGKPFVLPPEVVAAVNRTRNFNPAAPQHQLADLYTAYNWYSQNGWTTAAQGVGDQIQNIQKQLLADTTFQHQLAITDVHEKHQDDRFNTGQRNEDTRQDRTITAESDRESARQAYDGWLHSQPTYRDLHPSTSGGAAAKPEAIAKSTAQFYADWHKLTQPGHLKYPNQPPGPLNPLQAAPAIPPNVQGIAGKLFSRIDDSPDPVGTAQTLANGLGHIPTIPANVYPTLKELLYKRAAIAAAKKGTLSAPPPPTGGSQDDGDPQYPGP